MAVTQQIPAIQKTPPQKIVVEQLKNGLTVIVEEIENVESVAFELLVPGGVLYDPQDQVGASLLLAELTSRGAGPYDSRALSAAFEKLGARHSESAGQDQFSYQASLLAENFEAALELVSLMVQKPHLPEADVDGIKSILLQDIAGLFDNPARRCMTELGKVYFPAPYGRPGVGDAAGIQKCSRQAVEALWRKLYVPQGAVLSIAGKCETSSALKAAQRLFGGWQGQKTAKPLLQAMPPHKRHHISFDSAQMQIGLAWPSATFGSRHHYTAKIVDGILSGGMFGRLFIEVREKRGLVYSVYSRQRSTREWGAMFAYAGTTPERAQETLNVMLQVISGAGGALLPEELSRVKANLKSSVLIGEESSGSRAASNAHDYWLSGRVRSMGEIVAAIDSVSPQEIEDYMQQYPINSYMLMTLGSKELS